MRRTSRFTAAALAAVAISVVTGCERRSDGTTVQATAEEALCLSLKDFSAAMMAYYALPLENPKSDYEDRLSDARPALDQVVTSARDVSGVATEPLVLNYSELTNVIQSLGEDVYMGAVEQVGWAAIAVSQAWLEMYNGLRCAQYAPSS